MTRRQKKPPFPLAKQYEALHDAVEHGVGYGVSRWLKYRENPIKDRDRHNLEEHLVREVLNVIYARFVQV